mmetsp:Transcript_19911/g.37464  ORF Transcript_19911/g.37464 Transcript_19911/m.37464 type:complete len:466 (-) Transcript_19911:35-1432(-)|eukprot:CAMPEP_0197443812 /NCGR_PEP_ID=MMETSP1175-20131217/9457_1 /TAXON_ID=1003142 /ORGANISM="Triceratium dubium, Strain CCMP147" /LENGTH=465 /DNA_ID=CAMNT_0042974495 /DNA_START=193 /DNA_END=1590 /DNA_ORIENTATION=+
MSAERTRGTAALHLLLAAAPAALILPSVDAGFDIGSLSPFLSALPDTCTNPPGSDVVTGVVACFSSSAGPDCDCFLDSFEAPPIPEAFPATCDDATQGGMSNVMCALRECCPSCASNANDLWGCVGEGVPDIGVDCALVCPSVDPTPPVNDTENAVCDLLSPECQPACEGLMECFEGLAQSGDMSCPTCVENEMMNLTQALFELFLGGALNGMEGVSGTNDAPTENGQGDGMSQEDFFQDIVDGLCSLTEGIMCTISGCCPTCSNEIDAILACMGTSGIQVPDFSEGTEEGSQETTIVTCDASCDKQGKVEVSTTTTTPVPAVTTTAAPVAAYGEKPCREALAAYKACVPGPCGRCAINADPVVKPSSSCSALTTFLCEIDECCDGQCTGEASEVLRRCDFVRGGVGTAETLNQCNIDCDAVVETTTTAAPQQTFSGGGHASCGTESGAAMATAAAVGGLVFAAL